MDGGNSELRERLRRLILGDGETRIDSFDAADRILAAGWLPVCPPPRPVCPECDGWGRFWTRNKDGRFGPLYPASLPCPECGGGGLREGGGSHPTMPAEMPIPARRAAARAVPGKLSLGEWIAAYEAIRDTLAATDPEKDER